MKNIIDILKGLGIEVPEDKASDLNKEVAENYKTVAEFDKKVDKMQKEIDSVTERADKAEETLKGFEGKDFDEITSDRDKWKSEYEALIQKQKDEADLAELNGAIDKAIEDAKGKDAISIRAHLDMDAIKASKNRDKDIESAIKALSEDDSTSFLFSSKADEEQAQFTTPQGTQPPKADIHSTDLRAAFGLPAEN